MIELTWQVFAIACPLVFVAGFVDAIGGGGGLVSLPAYLLAGLPPHMAVATNKLSSTCGTAVATHRFARQKMIDWKLTISGVIMAIIGSGVGANISLLVSEQVMVYVLYAVLPISAFFVLNKKLFKDRSDDGENQGFRPQFLVGVIAFVIGIYDGFYGPGTGTFLIIAFTVFAGMNIAKANGLTKVINLTTNITSLIIFLIHGKVIIGLGVAAAVCNMLGGYLGAELAISKGSRITRPIILIVLFMLLIKVVDII